MTTMRISDQDLERLVHGDEPENQQLSQLADALQNWQAGFARIPKDEQVAAFASQAAAIAVKTKPATTEQTTTAPARSRLRALKYKLATGMAAVLMLSGMTGVAVASDGAAPGDALYGLDRALEAVGINNGGAAERITEAQSLFDDGLIAEAIEHAVEALDDDETATEAADALMAAAERVRMNAENGNAEDTLKTVAGMLEAMAGADRGPGFGQDVSWWAQRINANGPENGGPPVDLPQQANGNPQEDNSQNSGEPGRGNEGNRGNQGNNGNQGPADGPSGQSGKAKPGRP